MSEIVPFEISCSIDFTIDLVIVNVEYHSNKEQLHPMASYPLDFFFTMLLIVWNLINFRRLMGKYCVSTKLSWFWYLL